METRLAVLLLAFAAAPAYSFVDGTLTQTFGSNHYAGTKASADVGGDWHLSPMFSMYRSDISNGTFRTLSARGAYDTKLWGAGMTIGGTPSVDGYSNRFVGGDIGFSFTPGLAGPIRRLSRPAEGEAPEGEGLARVDVGASLLHTTHSDDLQLQAGAMPSRMGRVTRRRGSTLLLGQTDLSLNGGVSILDALLSAEITKSSYDKNLSALNAAPAAVVSLMGLAGIVQGFPDTAFNAQLKLSMFPIVEPYVSLTRTSFKLNLPSSTGVTVGATAGFDIVEVHASIEAYDPGGGQPKQTFAAMGAGVRF